MGWAQARYAEPVAVPGDDPGALAGVGGGHPLADERVEERGLARLHPAGDGHPEGLLEASRPRGQRARPGRCRRRRRGVGAAGPRTCWAQASRRVRLTASMAWRPAGAGRRSRARVGLGHAAPRTCCELRGHLGPGVPAPRRGRASSMLRPPPPGCASPTRGAPRPAPEVVAQRLVGVAQHVLRRLAGRQLGLLEVGLHGAQGLGRGAPAAGSPGPPCTALRPRVGGQHGRRPA